MAKPTPFAKAEKTLIEHFGTREAKKIIGALTKHPLDSFKAFVAGEMSGKEFKALSDDDKAALREKFDKASEAKKEKSDKAVKEARKRFEELNAKHQAKFDQILEPIKQRRQGSKEPQEKVVEVEKIVHRIVTMEPPPRTPWTFEHKRDRQGRPTSTLATDQNGRQWHFKHDRDSRGRVVVTQAQPMETKLIGASNEETANLG